jgi:prepilin-type processing-associated H-X9-DG protein
MPSPVPTPDTPVDPAGQWVPCYGITQNGGLSYNPSSNPMNPDWKNTGPRRGALFPYVKNLQVYVCPSDPFPSKMLSYSMNAVAGFIPDPVIERPSQFAELVDELDTMNDGLFLATTDFPTNVHSSGFNLAFFDGHAKWYRTDATNPTNWRNVTNPNLFCPSIPFNYVGDTTMCATE